ncbi:MAG: MarR family transcriptional regulator [Balneolaceae bacterium]|nr:MarR family transcriptional regulator [Balneolaceae bacterium]
MTGLAEEEFKRVGLAPTYAYLLMTVNDDPGIRPGEISRELRLSPSTVTRLLDKMEQRGYLRRESAGRAIRVEPTDEGLQLDNRLVAAWQRLRRRYQEELGERYAEVLTEMTYKATNKL